ncbi:hypothetical protein BC939DRAFT_207334 [Gamsiella multidivaricata]|uniref:uncharacterized protein n=1 Tax=Gamsiella multidivaricata TaxID=101098 RepID=UPI00221EB092|nr:uncharacterized protein BC939DRAFT_207334 [Gamsiella multidivaricata]KAG0354433.1 hypothetical protein BGZ54_001639 [Gamsiella multidivaricata]KAI7821339.1 hypothetical protein BC939DRAFT_207334 [Gamsiella multidivaricata]
MSHQRAASTSSISSAFDTQTNTNNASVKFKDGMADHPSSSTSATTAATPLAISIPRQRSFSSSFSLSATSPRTFTGSSIIANPSNGFLSSPGVSGSTTTPFSAAFAPLSPAAATPPNYSSSVPSGTAAGSQTVPVLHRRFSSSFNQLNQIAGSPPADGTIGSKTTERGRRTSLFAGTSPSMVTGTTAEANNHGSSINNHSSTSSANGAGSLFRKFSTTGRAAGQHPFDMNNDTAPVSAGAQPNSNTYISNTQQQQQHLNAVNKLKPQDKHSRSSSPMRSMILNGQMLD